MLPTNGNPSKATGPDFWIPRARLLRQAIRRSVNQQLEDPEGRIPKDQWIPTHRFL